jgi:hypothetical protein
VIMFDTREEYIKQRVIAIHIAFILTLHVIMDTLIPNSTNASRIQPAIDINDKVDKKRLNRYFTDQQNHFIKKQSHSNRKVSDNKRSTLKPTIRKKVLNSFKPFTKIGQNLVSSTELGQAWGLSHTSATRANVINAFLRPEKDDESMNLLKISYMKHYLTKINPIISAMKNLQLNLDQAKQLINTYVTTYLNQTHYLYTIPVTHNSKSVQFNCIDRDSTKQILEKLYTLIDCIQNTPIPTEDKQTIHVKLFDVKFTSSNSQTYTPVKHNEIYDILCPPASPPASPQASPQASQFASPQASQFASPQASQFASPHSHRSNPNSYPTQVSNNPWTQSHNAGQTQKPASSLTTNNNNNNYASAHGSPQPNNHQTGSKKQSQKVRGFRVQGRGRIRTAKMDRKPDGVVASVMKYLWGENPKPYSRKVGHLV